MTKIFKSLANKVQIYSDTNEAITQIKEYVSCNNKAVIAFVNAHAFNLAKKNNMFFENLMNANFLLRDGIGVKLYYKMIGLEPGYNLNGTDFIPELLAAMSTGKRVAVLGTTEDVILTAQPKIESLGGNVVLIDHGFHDVEHYLELVKNQKVDIYILAMGMPKQEKLANRLYNQVDQGVIICGGAIIDFLGGKVKRAPSIYRRFGLEWFYRLLNEPRRMFTRYIFGNISFLLTAFRSIK